MLDTFPVADEPGAAHHIAFTSTPGETAPATDFATQPVVTVQDNANKTVSATGNVTLALVPDLGTPLGELVCTPATAAVASGVATFGGCKVSKGGRYKLRATFGALTVDSGAFLITGPAYLDFSGGQPGGGTARLAWTNQPQVKVVDGAGATIAGEPQQIGLAIKPGTGTAGAALTCPDSNPKLNASGLVAFTGCSIDKAGTGYQLIAVAKNDQVIGTSGAFTITPGAAYALDFRTQPVGGAAGGLAVQPVVAVVDRGGNTVQSSTPMITLSAAGAAVSCAPMAAVAGVAAFTGCAVSPSGTYSLVATDGSRSTTSTEFTVVSGAPTAVAFTAQPGGGSAGSAFSNQPVVTIKDSGGNLVPGVVDLAIKAGTGTAGAALTCTADPEVAPAGTATFSGCRVDLDGDDYVLTATSGTLAVDSSAFDVTAGAARSLAFQSAPASGVGGGSLASAPVVTVKDIGGNPAGGAVTLSLAPGLGTPGAMLDCDLETKSASSGSVTFTGCSIDKAGEGYRLHAAVSGTPAAVVTSPPFDVSVGPAHHLAFTVQPGAGKGGSPLAAQPAVSVRDAGGNQVTDSAAEVELELAGDPGELTCTSNPLPATRGISVFAGCAVDETGSYALEASAGGLSGTSTGFLVTAGPAAQLLFSPQPGRGVPGSALNPQPIVTVADAGGNPAAGTTGDVRLTLTPGTGVADAVLGCSTTSAAGGAASFTTCSVDRAGGGYALTAAYGDLRAESLPFNVTPAVPAVLGSNPRPVPAAQTLGGRLYANNPTAVQDLVNTATGSLQTSVIDLQVAGVGHDLVLERTYNSADGAPGAFGPGWSSVLDVAVTVDKAGTSATVRGEDGQRVVFTRPKPTGSWIAPSGARSSLTCTTRTCTVLRYDGTSFEVAGTQLVSFLDANGQGLRFGYDAGKLRRILVATRDRKAARTVTVNTDAGGHVLSLLTPGRRTTTYTYSSATPTGVLKQVTDVLGKTWFYSHAGTRLNGIQDPDGTPRLAVGYDGAGQVTSVVEGGSARRVDSTFTWAAGSSTRSPLVGTTRRTYTDHYSGNVLVRQQQPDGSELRYGYDVQGNLTQVKDPAGWVQLMTYDASGHLLSQSTPLGGGATSTVRMTYDAQHRMIARTDANGNVFTYVYNGANLRSVRPPGPGAGATRLDYDNLGLLVATVTPLGRTRYTNDAYGNATRTVEQDLAGARLNGGGSTATFDEAGRMTSFASAMGIASSWEIDATGKTLSSVTPAGQTTNKYSDAGVPIWSETAHGGRTTYAWNETTLTRTTTVLETPKNLVSTQRYDGSGNVLEETSSNGLVTEHFYDALGREKETRTGTSNVRYTFDDASNVVLVQDSDGPELRQQFDAMNRLIRQLGDGDETRTAYDAAGNVTRTVDASGLTTTRVYDAHGNPRSVTDGEGTTSYLYDLGDNVLRRRDGRGGVTTWTYDAMSRATSMSVAGNATTYQHDLDGRLVKTTDPEGRVTSLSLDDAGRPLTTSHTGPGKDVTITQTFDRDGRRTSLDGDQISYDDRGNVTSEAGFAYDYAKPGMIVETYPGGEKKVTYRVDESGHLMSVSTGDDPTASGYVGASYIRDQDRRATGLALSNGVLQTRAFDPSGNLVDQTVRYGGTVLAHDTYTWDARGNRLTQRSTAMGRTVEHGYRYEASGRLSGARSDLLVTAEALPVGLPPIAPALPGGGLDPDEVAAPDDAIALPAEAPLLLPPGKAIDAPSATLGYDRVGNRTSTAEQTWTHGPADQIVTDSSGTVWTYDRSGAVTSRTGGNKPNATYTYDDAARLSTVTVGGKTVSYEYDGYGNRISRSGDGGLTTTYAWSPFGELPQLAVETTGSKTTYYIHGEGPIAAQTDDDVLYFHLDPLGSTNAVSDDQGALAAAYSYSAFGEVTEVGAPDAVSLLFHAQQLDRFSGLYNMRARQYDPDTGRFTQREPAATPVGVPVVSAYAFVNNQPTAKTDPTGRTVSTATVFAGQSTDDANTANNAKLAAKGAQITLKVVSKVGGYSAALASASASGTQLTKAAKIGAKMKFAGAQLAIIGIGLQTLVAVENCRSGPIEKCVGSVTGLAINVAFTVGCTFITSGVGSFACAMCGAALGIGLEYVISEFGPEIVDGLIQAWEAAAPWVSEAAMVTAAAFVAFGEDVSQAFTDAEGALVVAFDDTYMALETGYNDALVVLSDAGLAAVQIAELLADTFDLLGRDTVAALIGLGYSIADTAVILGQVFEEQALYVAQLLTASFDVATVELSRALDTAFTVLDEVVLTETLRAVGIAVDEIATALTDVYDSAEAEIVKLLDDAEYTLNQIGSALNAVFNPTPADIIRLLTSVASGVTEVAEVLRDIEAQLDQGVADALKAADYTAQQVATALKDVYDDSAAAVAAVLKEAEFAAAQVADALKEVFLAPQALATQLLRDVLFTVNDIAGALETIYLQGAAEVATLLRNVGYLVTDVAAALVAHFSDVAAAVAGVLQEVGFAVAEVAQALETTFALGAAAAAQVLDDLLYSAAQIATVLRGVFEQLDDEMATILKGLGEDIAVISGLLQSVYGTTAAVAADVLKALTYSMAEIGAVLQSVFHQSAQAAAQVLEGIGATAAQIAGVLENTFNVATAEVVGFLSDLGFNDSTINAIGGAFEDFGNDVADFFDSWF
ncbi:MAG: repeat-containing protein [Frankiales bacterium]|nr:repeat-containing protein [Frankiales bacterium]